MSSWMSYLMQWDEKMKKKKTQIGKKEIKLPLFEDDKIAYVKIQKNIIQKALESLSNSQQGCRTKD